jgi:HK97 family phage major capsid protein
VFHELSLVAVPANSRAAITVVKAESGPNPPGVSGSRTGPPMTIQEQITALENKRAANVARMNDLMAKAAEKGATFDDSEQQEYDTLEQSTKGVDEHLVRARTLEQMNLTKAITVTPAKDTKTASEIRGGAPVVQVVNTLAPDSLLLRYTLAKLAGKGSQNDAISYAERFTDTPQVALALKAAMAPATTTDATWAGALVPTAVSQGFIELLRNKTILGRIPNLYRVPFNVTVPMQTGGGTYAWVGEGAPKPVTKFALGTTSLGMAKIAAIIALTEELARLSVPSAEEVVRREMTNGIVAFMDQQFIDPTVAAVAGVSPGSITNGVTPIATAGDPVKDITAILNAFATANISVDSVVLIMSSTTAFQLGVKTNALGQAAFPTLGPTGGTVFGIPVVASNAAGNNVIGLAPEYILYADDGGVTIDVSREASVQLNSAPDNPATATTVMVSFWQQNLVGIRAERYVNWKRAINTAVAWVQNTAYPLATTEEAPHTSGKRA